MARKFSSIKKKIENSRFEFYEYLQKCEDADVMHFISEISKQTKVFIFSGVIRNFFLGEKNNRDIDIILEKEIDITHIFSNSEIRRNSFGGYKINHKDTIIDLWFLETTWAFSNREGRDLIQQPFAFGLERQVPSTAFFNFSAIVYSLNEKSFYYTEDFLRFLKDKRMDVVFEKNPNYKLCIVNTLYYSDKYHLEITEKLKKYIVELYHNNDKDFVQVQLRHFGKIIYSNDIIEHRVETIFYSRKRKSSNEERKLSRNI